MISGSESVWTIPADVDDLWVRVRWEDFSDPHQQLVEPSEACIVRVSELRGIESDKRYGFRSLDVYTDPGGTQSLGISPLLVDLDLDGGQQYDLDDLARRAVNEVTRRGWECRLYRSGTGYHIEIHPDSLPPGETFAQWTLSWREARAICMDDLRQTLDAKCSGGRPCVDLVSSRKWAIRMVGSHNSKREGAVKEQISRQRLWL
ncbi:MAG: hypothetical protein GY926_22530 [bacterium]|nr:hypothetical protein [bacterium]